MSQRASEAFARLSSTTPRVGVSGDPDTPISPASRRAAVRAFPLRIYRQDQADAIDALREIVAERLGRRPSVNELAGAALVTAQLYADQIAAYLAAHPNRSTP